MNSGIPEQSQDERQRAWEAAREAARRSGVSVSEWLDSVIAMKETAEPLRRTRLPEDIGQPKVAATNAPAPRLRNFDPDERPRRIPQEDLSAVKNRLDTLGRQLEDLARANAAKANPADAAPGASSRKPEWRPAPAPRSWQSEALPAWPRPRPAPPGAPAATSAATSLDQALLEIAHRQQALDGEAPPHAEPPRPQTQSLLDLEQQLRDITYRVDTMRPCVMDNAIENIRNDLAEIALMLKEAMPRRAVEALEIEVRALAERIDTKRNAGVDQDAIASLERGLAEMRETIRGLTPAESLVGLERAVDGLTQRIDLLSGGYRDPAALEQLESAIVGLRAIVSHVASNEALAKLSDEVRELAVKVDQITSSDALSMLEQRITAIADALQSRHQQNGEEARNLDAVFHGLNDKLAQLQLTRSDQTAVSHLEDRIATLVEKLDASDARLSHLEAIERGLAELLLHVEQERLPNAVRDAAAPEFETIKRGVQRNQDALDALHNTLGELVDKLAVIEADFRTSAPQAAAVASSAAPAAVRAATAVATPAKYDPAPAAAAAMAAAGNPAPATEHDRRPIDPDLPPDHPLEPGSGVGRGRQPTSPAERIAASEAALGPTKPVVIADSGGKSNFIAAARRAARAASSEAGTRVDRRVGALTGTDAAAAAGKASVGGQIRKRVRSLLVGASVVLLVLGSLQIAANLFFASKDSEVSGPDPAAQSTPDAAAPPEAVPQTPAAPANGRQSALLPDPKTLSSFPAPAGIMLPGMPSLTPPLAGSTPSGDSGATGSILPPPATAATTPAGADKLPAAIGSSGLRAAAVRGDPAAEFEIAVRFAEGRGVPQDFTAASEWFERAGKQGLAPAQFRLGGLYEKGMGVKKNLDAARRLYLAAAEAGNAKAMHNLAVLYAEGMDGKPDYQTAAKWFRKAADHGIGDSQYNLGVLYARGIGVEMNMGEAYKWFSLAAREGDADAAKKRDDVGSRLDEKSLMTARAAAQVWTAEPQPEAAIQVKAPAGGWDAAATPATPKRRAGSAAEATPSRSAQ
jgi:localization factor PodJL